MNFISIAFLFYFGIILIAYYLVPKRYQWQILLLGSLGFYGAAGIYGLFMLFLVTGITFIGAKAMDGLAYEQGKEKGRNRSLILSVTLLLLCFFCFRIGAFHGLLVPMGITFYILTAIGYLVDVKRGLVKAENNPFRLCLFLGFFPQLVQGPITRFEQMKIQFEADHYFDLSTLKRGLLRAMWGACKKLIVADRIAVAIITIIENETEYTGAYVFLTMLFYALQLYCDFTGGIDLAIGIGACFGIQLPENFHHPYAAQNVADYWRRWHISMGKWFSDYVYYPLSTCNPMKKLRKWMTQKGKKDMGRRLTLWASTFLTWLLIGLWHGFGTGFIAWGLLNGLFLMLSQEASRTRERFHEKYSFTQGKAYGYARILRTFLLIGMLRLFDLYHSAGKTFQMMLAMFTKWNNMAFMPSSLLELGLDEKDYILLLISTVILIMVERRRPLFFAETGKEKIENKPEEKTKERVITLLIIVTFFLVLVFGSYGLGFEPHDFVYSSY